MQGRYGADELYRFLIGAAVVCVVLNLFFRSRILEILYWVLLIFAIYRMLSRNYNARYEENQKYLKASSRFRYWFDQQRKLMEERKIHHIYSCPKCRQKIRIPKGKGKIMVRCPKCGHEFKKRS
jgi:ribosomal protein L37AE/L43A